MSIPARVTSLGSFHMQMNGSKQPLAIAPNPPPANTNHPKNSSSILLHSNHNNTTNNNSQSATKIASQVAGINMLNKLSKHNSTINHAAAASGNAAALADKKMSEEHQMYCELWHACAGPLVSVPLKGSRVVYFPQGHLEQVAASMKLQLGSEQQIPLYDLPPQIVCRVAELSLHADRETDEVFAQFTLVPLPQERQNCMEPEVPVPPKLATHMFCKTLTVSDTSTHGGFSVPRRAADECFAPLDYSQQRPSQEIVAKDLHGVEWKFRHIYRGQPRRHLLTTGWSLFVSSKKLVAGDSVLFLRKGNGELWVGIRRGNNRPATASTSSSCPAISPATSVLPSHSMHMGVLAAAAHALSTKSMFNVFYNPRTSASEFVISHHKYRKAFAHTLSVGMRFKMRFETEDGMERRYTGTISGIGDVDPVRWRDSKWRSLKVTWDDQQSAEGTTGMIHSHNSAGAPCRVRRRNEQQVSPWEIEPFLANSAALLADNLNLMHLPGIIGTAGPMGAIGPAGLLAQKRRHWSATYNVPPSIEFGLGSRSATSSTSPCNTNNLLAYNIQQQSELVLPNHDQMSFVNGEGVKRLRRMPGSNTEIGCLPAAMINADQQKLLMQGLVNHHSGSVSQKPSLILGQQQHHQGLNSSSSSSSSSVTSMPNSSSVHPTSLLRSQQANMRPLFWPPLMSPAMAPSAAAIKTASDHQVQHLDSSQLCNPNPSKNSAVPVVTNSSSGDGTTVCTAQSSHESMAAGLMLHTMVANPDLALNSAAMDMDNTAKAVQCSSPEENYSKDSTHTGSSSNQAEAKGNQLKLFGFSLKNAYKQSNPSRKMSAMTTITSSADEPRLSLSPRGSNHVFDENSLSLSLSPKDAAAVMNQIPESKEETSLPAAVNHSRAVTEKALVLSSTSDSDQSQEKQESVEVQLWPSQAHPNESHLISSRNRVKVLKKGHHVGRSIDLSKFNCYPELIQALEKLFNMEGQLSGGATARCSDQKMGWQITYTDIDGDTMLVGDDPWEEFVNIALKICIVTRDELINTSSAPGHSKLSEDYSSPV